MSFRSPRRHSHSFSSGCRINDSSFYPPSRRYDLPERCALYVRRAQGMNTMSKSERATAVMTPSQQKVLDQLEAGLRTWDQLRALTKLNDDNLGFAIGELLIQRKIWTDHRGEVRVYGIERRVGLVPRFAHQNRRSTDSHP